jgi:hypothetical protein
MEGRKEARQRERKAERKQEKKNGGKKSRKNKLLSFGFDGDGFIEGGVNDNSANAILGIIKKILCRIITRWLL